MTKIKFIDLPNQTTPITGANLNKLNNLAIDTTVEGHEEEVVVIQSKNLFNKNNANKISTYISNSNGSLGTEQTNQKTLYIPIQANTTYTVSKIASTRFVIATYTSKPTYSLTCSKFNANYTATSLSITSGASDKYLAVWYYNSSSDTSITEQQILDSLMIEVGSNASEYEPYVVSEIDTTIGKLTDTLNIGTDSNNAGLWVEHSHNLFDDKIESGGINYSTGLNEANSSRTRSANFIKVQPNTTYTMTYTKGLVRWILGYKSDKTQISDGTFNTSYNKAIAYKENASSITFTTTATTQYIRWYDTNSTLTNDKVMINVGSTALDYEPYVSPSIKVNNNGVYETIYQQPVVLWTNASPTSEFAAQTITLNDSIENYKYYEIYFKEYGTGTRYHTTGILPIGLLTSLMYQVHRNYIRNVNSISGTSVNFAAAVYYATYGTSSSSTTANTFLIPYQVIGYK